MDAKTFFSKVALMRKAQREYFRTRSASSLKMSIALEAEIDKEIERVYSIVGEPKPPQQTTLF